MVQVITHDPTIEETKSGSANRGRLDDELTPIRTIAIVGNSLYVATIAAALSRKFKRQKEMRIIAVQTSSANCSSLGESTLSALNTFHRFLGLKEHQMMAVTKATYKLATRYSNWRVDKADSASELLNSENTLYQCGNSDFYHAYSAYGSMVDAIAFQHHITKFQLMGTEIDLTRFSLPALLAKTGRFFKPETSRTAIPFSYAMHIDTVAYTKGMQDYAARLGVDFVVDNVITICKQPLNKPTKAATDMIRSITLANGRTIEADLFIDCSDKAELSGNCFTSKYLNWEPTLPCDRLISVKKNRVEAAKPYTDMSLHDYGYRRCFSLQDADVEEYFYSSSHLSDNKALEELGEDVSIFSQKIGCRLSFWSSNCVAMGNAAGNLGRLAVSNFHLVQSAVLRLIDIFPDTSLLRNGDYSSRDEYNSLTLEEYKRIQDYHSAHFAIPAIQSNSNASDFWQDYKQVTLPESLEHKLVLFKKTGRIPFYERETFSTDVWISLFIGLGWHADSYDALLDMPPASITRSESALNTIASKIERLCVQAPPHQQYLNEHCARSR